MHGIAMQMHRMNQKRLTNGSKATTRMMIAHKDGSPCVTMALFKNMPHSSVRLALFGCFFCTESKKNQQHSKPNHLHAQPAYIVKIAFSAL
jgi:hypothetical protein